MSSQDASVPMPCTPTRLRQVALVAADLERARHLLTSVLGTEVIFEDPAVQQWGLNNILVPIGGDIIEVVSPFESDTTASRQLAKRGDGGYMIIMQTTDAKARKQYIEQNRLAKVIFSHELEDSVCVQYHPKGIKGGVIAELDSHNISSSNPDPLSDPLSPWHAAGAPSSYPIYSAVMRKHSDLRLCSIVLRLAPDDHNTIGASKQWEDIFGVPRVNMEPSLAFTNATVIFTPGEKSKREGIERITIGVKDKERLENIFQRAKDEELRMSHEGFIEMLGILWKFVPLGTGDKRPESRLYLSHFVSRGHMLSLISASTGQSNACSREILVIKTTHFISVHGLNLMSSGVSGVDGTPLNVGISDRGTCRLRFDISRGSRIGSTRSTGNTWGRGVLGRWIWGIEPEHVGGVIIPHGHDQNHSLLQSSTHGGQTTLGRENVLIAECCLLSGAPAIADRVAGYTFDS